MIVPGFPWVVLLHLTRYKECPFLFVPPIQAQRRDQDHSDERVSDSRAFTRGGWRGVNPARPFRSFGEPQRT